MEGEAEAEAEKGNMSISMEGESSESALVREMMEVIETLGAFTSFRRTQRKECLSLVRRLRLLLPLLEEIRELDSSVPARSLNHLAGLKKALASAKKLLKSCNYGSKIYLVPSLSLSMYI